MSDHPDDQHDPRLTPAQEAEVRRQLAAARHTEPMPREVAERLDGVLADLGAEPVRKAAVVRLAHRRRRAATMLVAAAAVVVGGIAVGQLFAGSGEDDAGNASVSSEDQPAGPESQEAQGDADGGALSAPEAARAVLQVRPKAFASDVARVRERLPSALTKPPSDDAEAQSDRAFATAGCEPGSWGRGTYQPVRYGRASGYVVFRKPQGETQVADLFLCGGERAVRSVTLPTR